MSREKSHLASKLFLLKEMVVRDIRSRYAGSGLGLAWVFIHPVLWMVLYTAVFSVILRVPVERGFASFPEFLMAGLLPWMAIQEGISRSASALPDNAVMVKKAVFPIETLVLSVVLAAVVNQIVAFLIFGAYITYLGHLSPGWLLLALPALLLQVLLTYGIGCLAATLTAFLRDAAHAVGILLTVVFFATPIVYPLSLVPERFRPVIEANPMTHLVALYRCAFTLHALPPAGSLVYLAVFSLVVAAAGTALFAKARPHFADLI
ncbi:MAG: ABC transporter permease [Thermoplasmata archaeon]